MLERGWYLAGTNRFLQIRLVSALATSLAIGGAFYTVPLAAQTRDSTPAIEIPAEIMVAPAVVTPLQIKIDRADAVSQQAILMIRGLPPRVTLSEGRSFSPGVWAIPFRNVGKIEMAPAHDTSGSAELTFELVALDGKVLANAASTLYILPPGMVQDRGSADPKANSGNSIALTVGPIPSKPDLPVGSSQRRANLGTAPNQLKPNEIESARVMMSKGDENIQAGKISAARLFYKSAAESGYAAAALALGGTYDRRELARWKVVGGELADPAMARKWYEKARELGSVEAGRRLEGLEAR
jgi:hypothetical protein